MPVFRVSRAFGIGREAKAFLNMHAGLTRGVVPDPRRHEKQAERLRKVVRRQRNVVARQRSLVTRQREALRRKERQIEEQAETLANLREQRQREKRLAGKVKQQRLEIFRLENELAATKEFIERAWEDPAVAYESGEPEVGSLPDFIIIGAQKGGTSLLYRLLVEHPDVEPAATKELHFFNNNYSEGLSWYRRYFQQVKHEDGRKTVSGEATPAYLRDPRVPERMANTVPDARLIALLRNPVDRAYSHYQMWARRGDEVRSFGEATRQEMAGEAGVGYLVRGLYAEQLERFDFFAERDQLLVLKSEDFFSRRWDILGRVLAFLDLPPLEPFAVQPSTKSAYAPMDPSTRKRLEAYFEPHNQRLYDYLGVDFGW